MRVKVRLFATLVKYVPGTKPGIPFDSDLPDGSSISDLIERLKLPKEYVNITFINGRIQPIDFHLTNGDRVGIFPLIGGG
jgi:molybdopterin synthase sulfur carrier subunit